jgi:hypothetical protein
MKFKCELQLQILHHQHSITSEAFRSKRIKNQGATLIIEVILSHVQTSGHSQMYTSTYVPLTAR